VPKKYHTDLLLLLLFKIKIVKILWQLPKEITLSQVVLDKNIKPPYPPSLLKLKKDKTTPFSIFLEIITITY